MCHADCDIILRIMINVVTFNIQTYKLLMCTVKPLLRVQSRNTIERDNGYTI